MNVIDSPNIQLSGLLAATIQEFVFFLDHPAKEFQSNGLPANFFFIIILITLDPGAKEVRIPL